MVQFLHDTAKFLNIGINRRERGKQPIINLVRIMNHTMIGSAETNLAHPNVRG